ncbi:lactosylceramide 4-alpha-galactosyltransferase-like, partial [Ceratina calcarata]|uniref:Lactosylceramide 4-alpha-galactosyltransferase-like n=1 Tax=Ceratina calcarata TaxID=156304 RepID=A0AAJ7N940_9HYME
MKKPLLLYTCYITIFIVIMMVLMMDRSYNQRVPLFVTSGDANKTGRLLNFEPEVDKPLSDKNIFFIETSGITKGDLMLKSRQGCAVESAARMNPNMTVYLLLVSRSKVPNQSTKFFDQLESYPNVRIRCVYLDKYMENTPLEKWYKRGVWKESQWPISHMSDVLRYLTLWKYGGIYLDLDVVVT